MPNSTWIEAQFWTLVLGSILPPLGIIVHLIRTAEIRRYVLMSFAVALLVLACLDFVLLGRVAHLARHTPDLLANGIFLSEASAALYILPLAWGGVGINLLSFVITQHLRIVGNTTDTRERKRKFRYVPRPAVRATMITSPVFSEGISDDASCQR
jgi:small basic protein